MEKPESSRQVTAYNRMMDRVRQTLEQAEHGAGNALQQSIDAAKRRAVELDELTRDEAEQVGEWLHRDLDDAGYFLAKGRGLRDWLRFDLEQVEARLLEVFARAADQTRLDYLAFQERMEADATYQTGEITGPGTLRCEACAREVHFRDSGHIPPCPGCYGTRFRRVDAEDEGSTSLENDEG
jgi:hypothetical protein